MDRTRFDSLARGLAHNDRASRRRLLGGAVGAAFTMLPLATTLAAKGSAKDKARRRHGGSGDANPDLPGTQAGGVWEEKMQICHFGAGSGDYSIETVSAPALPDYLAQGDNLYIDCCVDADCVALPCLSPTGCIEGACAYDTLEGASCALEDGTLGTCSHDGTCIGTTVTSAGSAEPAPPAA